MEEDRITNLKIIGHKQKYYNVTSSRAFNKNFNNNTNNAILVIISAVETADTSSIDFYIDEIIIGSINNGISMNSNITFIVPAGSTYRATSSENYNIIKTWIELR